MEEGCGDVVFIVWCGYIALAGEVDGIRKSDEMVLCMLKHGRPLGIMRRWRVALKHGPRLAWINLR